MPLWCFKSSTCSNDRIAETWQVCCAEGETVCNDLGCGHIIDALNGTIGTTATTSNPGLVQGGLTGLYPYVGRPCDRDIPGFYLGSPTIGAHETINRNVCREVTLEWEPLPNNEASTAPTDDNTTDPEDWCPRIVGNTVERLRAGETLEFLGAYILDRSAPDGVCCQDGTSIVTPQTANANGLSDIANDCVTLSAGQCARPQNAAGQPYDPPPEIADNDWCYTLTAFRPCDPSNFFDETVFTPFVGVPNCNDVTIRIPCRCWERTFPAGTLRVNGVRTEGSEQTRTDPVTGARFIFRYMTVNIDLCYRRDGWDFDLLNAGTEQCSGGNREVVTDDNGYSRDHLIPLNLNGVALTPGQPESYMRFGICCADLADMPVLRSYIT